jgi:spoIIIJ-associated protein
MEATQEVKEAGRGVRAAEILKTVLGQLGVTAQIEPRDAGEDVVLKVQGVTGGEPVGLADPKAPLWEPIGYLVGKMLNRDPAKRCWVTIQTGPDVPGAPPVEERDEELVKLGKFLAERAKQLGKVLVVGPMGPRERRSIHLAVKEVGGVASRSEGEGSARRLLVVPEKLAPPPSPEGL